MDLDDLLADYECTETTKDSFEWHTKLNSDNVETDMEINRLPVFKCFKVGNLQPRSLQTSCSVGNCDICATATTCGKCNLGYKTESDGTCTEMTSLRNMAITAIVFNVIAVIASVVVNFFASRSLQPVWHLINQSQMFLAFTLIGIMECKFITHLTIFKL